MHVKSLSNYVPDVSQMAISFWSVELTRKVEILTALDMNKLLEKLPPWKLPNYGDCNLYVLLHGRIKRILANLLSIACVQLPCLVICGHEIVESCFQTWGTRYCMYDHVIQLYSWMYDHCEWVGMLIGGESALIKEVCGLMHCSVV